LSLSSQKYKLWIRDPGSEIRDPRSGIRDPGSGIRDPEKTYSGSGIPDPGVKKAPDPGSRFLIRNTAGSGINIPDPPHCSMDNERCVAEEVLAKNIDYRQQVIRDLLEKEQEFVSDLRHHVPFINKMWHGLKIIAGEIKH
jgi:hypothetical protein